jgi:hypothetical protein
MPAFLKGFSAAVGFKYTQSGNKCPHSKAALSPLAFFDGIRRHQIGGIGSFPPSQRLGGTLFGDPGRATPQTINT